MNKKTAFLIIAAAIVVAVVVVLTKTADQEPAAPDSPLQPQAKGIIGLSVLTLTNPGFHAMANAMKAEAAKHGYEVIVRDGERNPAKQKDQVQDFIVQQVEAIVLCPCDSITVGEAIKQANEAGIPVFTADIACLAEDAKVECHVAADNYTGGRQAGRAIIEAVGGNGKVAIIDHPEVESVIQRTKGFRDELDRARAEEGIDIEIVAVVPGHGESPESRQAAQDILQAQPDLDAFFAINDPSAMGVIAAIEEAGKGGKVKVVGFDGFKMGRQAIKDGKMYAEPVQHLDEIGRKTAELIVQFMKGEQIAPEFLIATTLYRREDAEKDPTLK